tara:strand:+ start:402 stop:785 length:384 start_codon:yes stop_codon:yes gene_type:complete
MKKLLGFLFLGFFLSGCYQSSLTYVAPATSGIAQGRLSQSLVSTSLSYGVKQKTGKTPIEHVLNESQIKTVEKQKQNLNLCIKNAEFCSAIKARIENTRREFFKKRFENTRKHLSDLNPKKVANLKN